MPRAKTRTFALPDEGQANEPVPVSEEELAVRGFRFEVDFEEGAWQATAWKLAEADPAGDADVYQPYLTFSAPTPVAAFLLLYGALVLPPQA